MISRIKIQNGHKKAEKSQNAFCDFCAFLWRIPSSGNNIGHGSRANRSSAFPDRESQSFLQRHRRDQLNRQVHVVARHDHLHPFGQICRPGHIRRPKIKLRPVSLKERRVPSPFFLRQHIHFRLELRVRRDRCPLGHHLSPLDFFLLGPPQQQSHVVAGLPFIQEFLEHLHARDHRLERRPESHDLHLLAHLHHTPLDPSRHHRPPASHSSPADPAPPTPPNPATPDLPPRRTWSKTPRCRAPPPAAPTKCALASAASARPWPPPPISPHPSAPPP